MDKVIKLAIVDDDDISKRIIGIHLKNAKNIKIILEASNGKELQDALALKKQKPDVILMDLEMPVMDGIETTEYLDKQYPDIKILILTVHDDEKISNHLIEKGANGFLTKHADMNILVKAITTVYESGYYFEGWDLKKIVNLKKIRNKVNSKSKVIFSKRELEIIKLLLQGYTNKEISTKLNISTRTVEVHRDNVLKKTNSRNIAHFAVYAVQHGLIDFNDEKK